MLHCEEVRSASIVSTGSYLPARSIRNEELTHFPAASLPLIEQKTGIVARHHAGPGEFTSTLAREAASSCLAKVAFSPDGVDTLILATSTPDRLIPATAAKVGHEIGATRAFCFDINSVCSGGVYAMELARSLVVSGASNNVLVVAADTYSKFLNRREFSTYPYFGDGAGAVLVSSEQSGYELLGGVFHTDGSGYDVISIKGGAGEMPAASSPPPADCYFKMNGRAVFEFAVAKGSEVILEILEKYRIKKEDVSLFVLHQANINILTGISKNLGVDASRFYSNLRNVGNTAGASVLLAMDGCLNAPDSLQGGKYVVAAAFGGGLSWGAVALRIPVQSH